MSPKASYENIAGAMSILETGALTRNEIAEALGISLTGARDIVSFLTDNKFAGEYTKRPRQGGRSSGAVYLRNDPVFAIADIFGDRIETYVFGYNLKICEKYTYRIKDHLFLDDSYTEYFLIIAEAFRKLRCICFLGDCSAVDGRFTDSAIHGLKNIPLADMASEHLGDVTVMTECRDLYVPANTSGLNAVIRESGKTISASVLFGDCIISNMPKTPFSVGGTRFIGRCLNKRIAYSKDSFEYASAIADFMHMLICLISADSIYFSSDTYTNAAVLLKRAKEKLMLEYGYSPTQIPELIPVENGVPEESVRLRRHVRNNCIKYLL